MGTVELKLRDQVLKRTMDIVGGIVGCIISIPIIALVAIPLKLESPGPLIFKQRRVGRNGRVFYIHKLRSMYVDAEARKKELMAQNEMNGLMFKMEDDPRGSPGWAASSVAPASMSCRSFLTLCGAP